MVMVNHRGGCGRCQAPGPVLSYSWDVTADGAREFMCESCRSKDGRAAQQARDTAHCALALVCGCLLGILLIRSLP